MIRGAGILFVSPHGTALFLRRTSSAPDFPGYWNFPGGGQEGDESAEECATREAIEEVGELPGGERRFHTRTRPAEVGAPGIASGGLPFATPAGPPAPAPLEAWPAADFTTFVQEISKEFTPVLNDEHDGWAWAPIGTPPEPLHPGCRVALDRIAMDELGVARAIAAGHLTSPQRYENVALWAIRITGTDTAFRTKNEEFVHRRPELYLTEEFLARCNGLTVVYQHPKKGLLSSEEFGNRVVGSIFLPYIAGSEVWGIAKIYDDAANQAMEEECLSTSPGVNFADFTVNAQLRLEDGSKVLIEGKPSLLDHVAICELGVWDKGGEAAGIRSETAREDSAMTKEEEKATADKAKKDADEEKEKEAADKAKKDADEEEAQKKAAAADKSKHDADAGNALDKKLEHGFNALTDALDKMHKRMDAFEERDKEREDKRRKDAEEEARKKGDPEQLAADKAKKDAEETAKKAAADKAKKDEEEKAKADSQAIKQRIEEVASMVKPLADDEHHLIADAYNRADEVFSAFGKTTPRPIPGESAGQYRRRVTKLLKEHSPTWKGVDLGSQAFTDEAAFAIAENQIMTQARATALSPATVKAGELRMIERRRDGHIVREFVGEPRTWMDPLAGPVQLRGEGSFKTGNLGR